MKNLMGEKFHSVLFVCGSFEGIEVCWNDNKLCR